MRTISANTIEQASIIGDDAQVEQVAIIASDDEDADLGTPEEVLAILTSRPDEEEGLDPEIYGNIKTVEPAEDDPEYEEVYPQWVADHAPDGVDDEVEEETYEMVVEELDLRYKEGLLTELDRDKLLVLYSNKYDVPLDDAFLAKVAAALEAENEQAREEDRQIAAEAIDEEMIQYHSTSPFPPAATDMFETVEQIKDSMTGIRSEEFNDLGNNAVMQAEMDALAEQHDSAVDREELLKEIHDYYELLDMPTMGRNFSLMDNIALQDHLYLLRSNNGGSITMSKLLLETELEYDRLLKSDTVTMRLRLIEQRSTDVVKMMQKLRSLVGNDFVISGVRTSEYHSMLKSAVSFISTMHDKISMVGEQLGLRLPVNEFNAKIDNIPIVQGMPADPRVAIYVLNAVMAYIDKFANQLEVQQKQIVRTETQVAGHKSREEHLNKLVEQANAYVASMTQEMDKFRANSSYWIIQDDKGQMLRAINPDEPIRRSTDLDLRGDFYTALQFRSKTGAREWSERLMATKRFRGRVLKVFRASIVEDN